MNPLAAIRIRILVGDGLACLVRLVWLAALPAGRRGSIVRGHLSVSPLAIFVVLALMRGWAPSNCRARRGSWRKPGRRAGPHLFFSFYAQRYADLQPGLENIFPPPPPSRPLGDPAGLSCAAGLLPDGRPGAVQTQPFLHASGLIALERECVDLSDYEGGTDHFPTQFRPGLSFASRQEALGDNPDPNALDPERYERRTGVRIDARYFGRTPTTGWTTPGSPGCAAASKNFSGCPTFQNQTA